MQPLALVFALALAAPQVTAPAPPVRAPAEIVARLVAALDDARREWGFPGASAGVVLPDGTLAEVVVGFADDQQSRALQIDDRLLAGSIGKTFVSAVALLLTDEGSLELDQYLADWLGRDPWFERLPNHANVTLRDLLRHRSGIPEHVLLPEFGRALRDAPDRRWAGEELVAFVLDRAPLFAPGEAFAYSDTNFVLVALAVERAADADWYTLIGERVLEPLGLEGIVPAVGREVERLVPGHLAANNPFGWPSTTHANGRFVVDPQFEHAGGGFAATGPDLARWAFALYGGDFLSPARKRELLDTHETHSQRSPGRYGLGAQEKDSALGPVHGHGGWFPGYRSVMGYFPEHELAAAVQINTDDPARLRSLDDLLVTLAQTALEK